MGFAARLRDLLDKYDLLLELQAGTAGRTPARRDAMRRIAARFPAALREWDSLPAAELVRRRQAVQALLSRAEAAAAEEALLAETEPWLRYALDLHEALRELLRLRRLSQVAAPPSGHLTDLAYSDIARRHGVTVAEVKQALFTGGTHP